MTANSGGIDAFFTSLHVEKKRFWKAGWYHPLNKFLDDKSLTNPEYDWNDFTPGAKAGVTQPDGSISALAAFVDANVFFYRKDLFGPKGLTLLSGEFVGSALRDARGTAVLISPASGDAMPA